jgi:hypothetical protein
MRIRLEGMANPEHIAMLRGGLALWSSAQFQEFRTVKLRGELKIATNQKRRKIAALCHFKVPVLLALSGA